VRSWLSLGTCFRKPWRDCQRSASRFTCAAATGPRTSKALTGYYRPLPRSLNAQILLPKLCAPRARDLDALGGLRDDQRITVGIVNQKRQQPETIDEPLARADQAIRHLGRERVLLTTDCGFATFADNPIVTAEAAKQKLSVLSQVRDHLRSRTHTTVTP
jgi:5-methyltetrahydropteroyltriglutamate--homocysteine methyltransferase